MDVVAAVVLAALVSGAAVAVRNCLEKSLFSMGGSAA